MLLSDVPHWDFLPLAVRNRNTKDLFTQENTLRVVAKRAVSEVGKKRLRLVKPIMNRQAVFGLPAESLRAALCMLQRVCHAIILMTARPHRSVAASTRKLAMKGQIAEKVPS